MPQWQKAMKMAQESGHGGVPNMLFRGEPHFLYQVTISERTVIPTERSDEEALRCGMWIWPILGIVLLPWTTIMYFIVTPGGMIGWDWFWVGLMLIADIASYASGYGRDRIPYYEGY